MVGYIDQVGPGVSSDRIGERVVVDPFLYVGPNENLTRNDFLGSERDGGFADLLTIPRSERPRGANSPQ